jgi:hypothetical protein
MFNDHETIGVIAERVYTHPTQELTSPLTLTMFRVRLLHANLNVSTRCSSNGLEKQCFHDSKQLSWLSSMFVVSIGQRGPSLQK